MTKRRTLVTFGCSWTYGVGAHYTKDLSESEYMETRNSEDIVFPYSFRGILSKKFSLTNHNLSKGGASNEYNFETANEIFGDSEKRKRLLDSKPIVLWGITATPRIYRKSKNLFLPHNRPQSILYFLDDPSYIQNPSLDDLKYILNDQEFLYCALHLKLFYDHDHEVRKLANLIQIWNDIFDFHDIPVIWFDTFNTHNYYNHPKNYIAEGDLCSQLLKHQKIDIKSGKKWYHLSEWCDDDPRITAAVKNDLLNPFTYHPNQTGHQIIASLLSSKLEPYLS